MCAACITKYFNCASLPITSELKRGSQPRLEVLVWVPICLSRSVRSPGTIDPTVACATCPWRTQHHLRWGYWRALQKKLPNLLHKLTNLFRLSCRTSGRYRNVCLCATKRCPQILWCLVIHVWDFLRDPCSSPMRAHTRKRDWRLFPWRGTPYSGKLCGAHSLFNLKNWRTKVLLKSPFSLKVLNRMENWSVTFCSIMISKPLDYLLDQLYQNLRPISCCIYTILWAEISNVPSIMRFWSHFNVILMFLNVFQWSNFTSVW